MRTNRYRWLTKALILLSFAVSGGFFVYGLEWFSIPLFEGDAWHLVDVAFSDASLIEGFITQHGPHRLGLAFVFHRFAALFGMEYGYTHSFIQGCIWLATAWFALRILKRVRGHYSPWDVLVPFIFFDPGLLQSSIYSPYIHGLTPLFALLLLEGMLWKKKWKRVSLILTVLFVSAYTFNANLLLVAFFPVAIIQWFRLKEKEWLFYTVWIVIIGTVFLFTTQVDQFTSTLETEFSWSGALIYWVELTSLPIFYTAESSNFTVALILLVLVLLTWSISIFGNTRSKIQWGIREFLILTVVLFWLINTLTRWSSGPGNAHAARYYPMVPLILLSLYICIQSLNLRVKSVSIVLFAFLVLFSWNSGRDSRFELERKMYQSLENSEQVNSSKGLEHFHPFPERVNLEENIRKIENQ